VELLDVSGEGKTCPTIPDYPLEVGLLTAAFYQGKVVACGGLLNSPTVDWIPTDRCFSLGPDLSKWEEMYSLPYGPTHALASSVFDNKWLISGGTNIIENTFTNKTMVLDGFIFLPSPDMPKAKDFHCQLTINSTHIFFASSFKYTFILNWQTQEYVPVDDMPNPMTVAACGLFKNKDLELEAIVANGYNSNIFSFTDFKWRDGPIVPEKVQNVATTSIKNGALSIGGWDGREDFFTSIYKFDNSLYDWTPVGIELSVKREEAAAVAVPDDFAKCQ